jgi:predicted permease
MLDILAITGPIYFCIALGYAVTRWGLFAKAEMRVLGKFVINLALPALLVNAISQRPLREVMHTDYLLAYALGSLTVMLAGYAWARYVQRSALSYHAYFAMGMSCSNSGYVGYPVALLALGPVAGVGLALNMVVENLFMLPLLMVLADAGDKSEGHALKVLGQTLLRLLTNPMILAILLGFAYSLSGLQLPGPVARTINVFAQATSALALSVIGGTNQGHSGPGEQNYFWKASYAPLGGLGVRNLDRTDCRSSVAHRRRGVCGHAHAGHFSHHGPTAWARGHRCSRAANYHHCIILYPQRPAVDA